MFPLCFLPASRIPHPAPIPLLLSSILNLVKNMPIGPEEVARVFSVSKREEGREGGSGAEGVGFLFFFGPSGGLKSMRESRDQ